MAAGNDRVMDRFAPWSRQVSQAVAIITTISLDIYSATLYLDVQRSEQANR
jgi:hypothetical protein